MLYQNPCNNEVSYKDDLVYVQLCTYTRLLPPTTAHSLSNHILSLHKQANLKLIVDNKQANLFTKYTLSLL